MFQMRSSDVQFVTLILISVIKGGKITKKSFLFWNIKLNLLFLVPAKVNSRQITNGRRNCCILNYCHTRVMFSF